MRQKLKFLILSAVLFLSYCSATFAQSAIIRGEVSAGTYENLKSDGNGVLYTTPSLTSYVAPTFAQTAPEVTNASTTLLAARASRKFLFVQNNDAAGIVYLNFGAAATTAHMQILPGYSLTLYTAPGGTVTGIGSIASNTNVTVIEGY